ncbi:hypothetical protein CIW52_06885 [Mycolicibacterium sp. P9-64]|uniref:carboxymuconolactone decarboxylase family protein n=1 Tax=Mycolicibacterium sp. P9-64 TaxID=2024612 RepID=UPI0011EE027E|nr:hypothetical protein [Mycolicibacterium sp. P9-64]KAA0085611.1 hypothetical protein CIW52_06885 [Mycolicibacterium sp. P9-64]
MSEVETDVRISPLRPPFSPAAAALLRRMTVPAGKEDDPVYEAFAERAPAIFAILARNEALAELMAHVRAFTHGGSGIPTRERELLVHRVTARLNAEYEWSMHAAVLGVAVGLDQATIDATVTAEGSDPCWAGVDALIIRLVDELIDTNEVSDELWSALSVHYEQSEVLSLLFLTGLYTTYSWLGNGVRVQVEPGTPRFPRRARARTTVT